MDIETLVRDSLAHHAEDAASAPDLLAAARRRGRRLQQRRHGVVAVTTTASLAAAGIGVGMLATEGGRGAQTVQPLDATDSASAGPSDSPSVASSTVPMQPYDACRDGQVARMTLTADHAVASGDIPAGTTDAAAHHFALAGYLRSLNHPAWVRGTVGVLVDDPGVMVVASGDDSSSSKASDVVVLKLSSDDSGWAAYPAVFDGCVASPS
jgi:hypothetical protein